MKCTCLLFQGFPLINPDRERQVSYPKIVLQHAYPAKQEVDGAIRSSLSVKAKFHQTRIYFLSLPEKTNKFSITKFLDPTYNFQNHRCVEEYIFNFYSTF